MVDRKKYQDWRKQTRRKTSINSEVRRLNSQFQREARKYKEKFIKEKSQEKHTNEYDQDSKLIWLFIPKTDVFKCKNTEKITGKSTILEICKKYKAELYKTNK